MLEAKPDCGDATTWLEPVPDQRSQEANQH